MAEIFDLQKALEIRDGLFAVTDSIVEHYESKATKMFPDAIREIERLQADVEGLQEALVDSGKPISIKSRERAKRIAELEADIVQRALASDCDKSTIGRQASDIKTMANRLEEFEDHEQQTHEILGAILGTDDSLEECAKRAMNRIKSLEAALIEERAKCAMLIEKLKDVANNPDWETRGLSKKYDTYIQESREELHIAGLIGNNDRPVEPAKLLLTAEQREALEFAATYLSDDPNDNRDFELTNSFNSIRNMLSGPVLAWEATEERKTVLENCISGYGPGEGALREYDANVLRGMLTEAKP